MNIVKVFNKNLSLIFQTLEMLPQKMSEFGPGTPHTFNMTGQPTPLPNVPPPAEIRPYDQGWLTIGFPNEGLSKH